MEPTSSQPVYTYANPAGRRSKALGIIVLVVLLGLIGGLVALYYQAATKQAELSASNAALQKKVTDLTRQLRAAGIAVHDTPTGSAATNATTPADTCSATISAALQTSIANAVKTRNFVSLQNYMASEVTVVIAASEKGGKESASQAVDDMRYLNGTTDPWDFALPAATTTAWSKKFYGQYFSGKFVAGQAASDEVVSFQFDACGKIDTVFMASDYRSLE